MAVKAILGGTFDPVHRGHLHAAAVGRALLVAPKVTLMLAARPWHRAAPATSVEHRLCMLRLAAGADPHLEASDWEARREGPSYTVDTLTALADGEPLVWLIGGDAFAAVDSWHRVDDLPALCHFLVLNRPGGGHEACTPKGFRRIDDPAALAHRSSGCVCFASATMLDVSATQVRRAIADDNPVDELLTPEVWAYIRSHGCTVADSPEADAESLKALVATAVDDRKAVDPVVLDVSSMTELTEYMVIATGTSNRHVKAIVDSVVETAKANGFNVLGTEGRDGNDWVLIDLADVVVHVMRPEARAFYDLERLWEAVTEPAQGGSIHPE